jgi:hypothetical protein
MRTSLSPPAKRSKVSSKKSSKSTPLGLVPYSSYSSIPSSSPLSSSDFKLQTIINGLHSSATLVVDEKKLATMVFNPETVALGRAVIGNWQAKFRTSRASRLTSGTSTLQVIVSTDLSLQSEGAALTALFDEVKGVRSTIQILGNGTGSPPAVVHVGFEPIVSTVTPTIALVARLPGASLLTSQNYMGTPYVLTRSFGAGRQWGLTSDEGVSAPRIASGMNGNWSFASDNAVTTPGSAFVYFAYALRVDAVFRNRG